MRRIVAVYAHAMWHMSMHVCICVRTSICACVCTHVCACVISEVAPFSRFLVIHYSHSTYILIAPLLFLSCGTVCVYC